MKCLFPFLSSFYSYFTSLFHSFAHLFPFYTSLFYIYIYIYICMYLSLSPPAPSSFSFRLFVSPLSSSFSSRRPIVADGESSCVRLERKGNRNFVALCFLFHRGRTRNGHSGPRSATRTEEEENLLRFLPPIIELESFARMEGLKESASETKSWGQRRGCSRQRDGDLAVRSCARTKGYY